MGADDKTTKTQPEMAQPEHHRPASIRGIDGDEINTINDGGDIMDSKEQSDEPVQNIFNQGGKNYRTLGKWDTVFVLVTNQVGLGVLSLPGCLKVLGVVPGVIAIIGLGSLSAYTAYELLQFYRKYPHVVNVVDMCGIIGGRPLEIIAGIGLMIKVMMTCASASVTLSVAFNTLSNHAFCTVSFVIIAVVACWVLCLPRTVKFVSQSGIPSTLSILAAALTVMISLGLDTPSQAPPGWDREIQVIGNPTFRQGLNACLKICYAYAGNISFVSYMAEMKNPSRDFPMALACLEVFSITLYTIVAVAIYCLAGDYTTSPALGSAPRIAAKVAYGLVLPCVFATAMAFGHTGIKYMYVVAMRSIKATHQVTDRSFKSWGIWVACVTLYWIIVFVISNAIPIFDSILSISSATTIAWFTFGLSAIFWFHINKGQYTKNWKKIALCIINGMLIVQSLFMNGGGLWSSITELLNIFENDKSSIRGVFSCGDNSI
ncbi:neutral amino acid permease [Fusarium tjaetaba]|uniref:Neutral amino acid permease n=1 Tax=Fusarium tjaetaba TaxID=1567544 RepID=A0A8H5RL28_9HYPO|nr:neutral amino acid permease [Fusarium tjaetaba]KAF5636731.1 neutral amino acid permease [Fusarium tjaetaba]